MADAPERKARSYDMAEDRAPMPTQSPTGVRALTGVITDESGIPLPGASVSIPCYSTSAVSDLDGQFVLLVPSHEDSLQFSYVGFASQTINIADSTTIRVAMEPENLMLSEVVVVSNLPTRVQSSIRRAKAYGPKPNSGFESYFAYLMDNLKVPGYVDGTEYMGDMRVNFVVDEYGSPQDVNVTKTVGLGLRNDLVNLVKNGPTWTPATDGVVFVAKAISLDVPIYR